MGMEKTARPTLKTIPPTGDAMGAMWEYMAACTARGAAAERTKAAYTAAIGLFLTWCWETSLDPLTAKMADIENWRAARLAAGDSPGSVQLRLSAVRTLYKALARAGKVGSNPAEYVKSPRPKATTADSVMGRVVFPEQMNVVLGKLAADPRGLRDRALLLTLYLLGLRVSEAAGLDWEDWRGDTLTFRAKGGQARELSLPAPLKEALAKLGDSPERTGPMFAAAGARLTVRAIQKMVGVRLRAGGLPGLSPHALRHSCATVAAIGGSSPFAIQDQLGHASQRTTAIYTRVAGRFLEAPSAVVARGMGV